MSGILLRKIILLALLSLLASLLFSPISAQTTSEKNKKPYVNILTWWGYLDQSKPQIKQIETRCNVNISYDNFYSNEQFINRLYNTNVHYDIIIFSQTILDAVKNKINLPSSNLYLQSNQYYPLIRRHYLQDKLPHNVLYFMNSLTGFLYNPKVIKLNPEDSVYKIFHDAGSNIVVMIDDPIEANFLISLLINKNNPLSMKNADEIALTWNNFKNLVQNTQVIITNSPQHIIQLPNFAFAFQWSGDAIQLMQHSHGRLKFLVHPALSYMSSDLLAELNTNKATQCVAMQLSGKRFLNNLQNRVEYFSPYMNDKVIRNKYFKKIYEDALKALPTLPWIISIPMENFKEINNSWEIIKYNLDKKNSP